MASKAERSIANPVPPVLNPSESVPTPPRALLYPVYPLLPLVYGINILNESFPPLRNKHTKALYPDVFDAAPAVIRMVHNVE